jgi:alpha-glucosidase
MSVFLYVSICRYPDWEKLASTIQPARLTTYMNPYLANTVAANKKNYRRDLFAEAASLGYLVQNTTGQPYIQSSASASFTFGTIDLTNPDACRWTRNIIRCNMLGDQTGCPPNVTAIRGPQSGFMSDFGEYLPWDSVVASGEPASKVHNQFPSLWAETCREAIHEANLDQEVTFFSRSASATSPKYSTLFWAGDQLTSWDLFDGMQSECARSFSISLLPSSFFLLPSSFFSSDML